MNTNSWIDFRALLPAALGKKPADLVLKGGRVLNVFTGEIETLDIAVSQGAIVGLGSYSGLEEIDVAGLFLSPGLIDPHFHIESSMVAPAELARAIVPRGVTAAVADPHEIANVLGLRGIDYLIESSRDIPLDLFFMAPSCVPATHLETSGAVLEAEDLKPLLKDPDVPGLAEVMNFPGVIMGSTSIWDKVELFSKKPIDGHAPLLSGPELAAYLLAGVGSDHECTRLEEAREKLARGMRIFIRQGSQAQNLADLLPLVTDDNFRRISFCTDDCHSEDIISKGHLDHVVRLAVSLGLSPARALIMATHNAAEAHRLRRRGALAPGYLADLVVFDSPESLQAKMVFKNGRLMARDGCMTVDIPRASMPDWVSPMNLAPLSLAALEVKTAGPRVQVIELVPNQILTSRTIVDAPSRDGLLTADPARDLARLVVLERHKGTGNIGQGLVRGFGLQRGALASSVAHDSHNIVAVGMSLPEILVAVRAVEKMRGGLAAANGEELLFQLPLPIAGLMSDRPAREVGEDCRKARAAARRLGCVPENPFMVLSFLALPVIPTLKLTDRGLVDVEAFDFTPLFVK
ncbi:MAG: adenine deaminase [Pseudomonadota bacterium]